MSSILVFAGSCGSLAADGCLGFQLPLSGWGWRGAGRSRSLCWHCAGRPCRGFPLCAVCQLVPVLNACMHWTSHPRAAIPKGRSLVRRCGVLITEQIAVLLCRCCRWKIALAEVKPVLWESLIFLRKELAQRSLPSAAIACGAPVWGWVAVGQAVLGWAAVPDGALVRLWFALRCRGSTACSAASRGLTALFRGMSVTPCLCRGFWLSSERPLLYRLLYYDLGTVWFLTYF